MLNPDQKLNSKIFDLQVEQAPIRDGFGEGLLEKINKKTEQLDHLPYGLSQKRYKLYEELMEELKRKSQNEYDAIYNIL